MAALTFDGIQFYNGAWSGSYANQKEGAQVGPNGSTSNNNVCVMRFKKDDFSYEYDDYTITLTFDYVSSYSSNGSVVFYRANPVTSTKPNTSGYSNTSNAIIAEATFSEVKCLQEMFL